MRINAWKRLAAVGFVACWALVGVSSAQALSSNVLILGSTVTGGATSLEAKEVTAQGLTPVVVDDATWRTTTQSQFSSYRAIVLGDATCTHLSVAQAAQDTVSRWGPAVTGNVLMNGTDPVYHASQGGTAVTQKAIDFVIANPSRTGAYISLSCYYHGTAARTPVPLLDAIRPGGFTVTGVGCYNNAHIVASHPALSGLTDSDLSNWSCSVHEAFDSWPADFSPLAIAKDFGSSFTASDGTIGTPYMLASGGGLRSFPLSVTPTSRTLRTGSSARFTAQLLDADTRRPVAGTTIHFLIESGPHQGTGGFCLGSCQTDSAGHVAWTYSGPGSGTDQIRIYVDKDGDGKPSPGDPQTTAVARFLEPLQYTALGDSFSSGESNRPFESVVPSCDRSRDYSYPRILPTLTGFVKKANFWACTGAHTEHVITSKQPHKAPQPIQLSTVRSTDDLVTMTIGGDDAGFSDIMKTCINDDDCRKPLRAKEAEIRGLKDRIAGTFEIVRRHEGDGYLLAGGYPHFFADHYGDRFGGHVNCKAGISRDEARFVNGLIDAGDETISQAVDLVNDRAHIGKRVVFVDPRPYFHDHELCTKYEWMRGIFASHPFTESYHPRPEGQGAYAQAFLDALVKALGASFPTKGS